MINRLFATGSAALLITALSWCVPAHGSEGRDETLDELVRIAWEANPDLKAIENQIRALEEKVTQSGAWKDPMLSAEYSNAPVDTFALGDHPMSGIQLRLEQTLPFPGKTGKREQVARARADAADHELAESRNRLRGALKNAYWNLTLNRLLKQITQQHILLVDQLIQSVRSRFELGTAGQQELLRFNVLREMLADELRDFDRTDVDLTATINTALNRPVHLFIQTPDRIEPSSPSLDPEAWHGKARRSRPVLKKWNKQAEAERLAAGQASYEGWPDPTVWLGYRFRQEVQGPQGMVTDEGTDFFSIGLAMPIPVFYPRSWGAAKQESLARERSALSMEDSLRNTIRGEIEKAFARWRRAHQKAETYRQSILPAQQQALEATLASYRVGGSDFLSLYSAQIGLLEVERMLVRAQAQTRIYEASVEMLVGEGLPSSGGQP